MCRMDIKQEVPCVIVALVLFAKLCLGDLEPTFARCCTLGGNWASEGLKCIQFPAPVAGVPAEEQSICLSAVEVCCIRTHREQMCESGKGAAEEEKDCIVDKRLGGEYHKDCCEACKLGMISGSMGHGCKFSKFSFGYPWDSAYQSCCLKTSPATTSPVTKPSSLSIPSQKQTSSSPNLPTPALDSICDLVGPGELCAHICIPIPGSYRCECPRGFSLMPDGKSCEQEDLPDRCKVNNPCSQKCFDTGVAIECSCHSGYQLQADERSCTDIDECQLEIDSCDHTTQICRNEPGSYLCENSDGTVSKPLQRKDKSADNNSGRCPVGYQFNFQSQVCDDIDECQLKTTDCLQNQVCQNTIGSYNCVGQGALDDCSPGFRYNSVQKTCRDINECAEATDNCDRDKQNCLNVDGGFTCQDRAAKSQCPAGYKFNKVLSKCEDVDECSENLHSCLFGTENCRNIDGAYECDIKCGAGLRYDAVHRACLDINECEGNSSKCTALETCVNTVGSHYCLRKSMQTCPAGYKPSAESQSGCQDVDECQEDINPCDRGTETCVNEIGSYHCAPVMSSIQNLVGVSTIKLEEPSVKNHCPSGYTFNFDRKLCLDINECLLNAHNCSLVNDEECVNEPGGFTCRRKTMCPRGYKFSQVTQNCEDQDECLDGTANCNSNERCVNIIGSYQCVPKCPYGSHINPNNPMDCVDTDECAQGTDTCNRRHEICSNTAGGFRCLPRNRPQPTSQRPLLNQCPLGFQIDTNLSGCIDVNECNEVRSPCNAGQDCINTHGSYVCVPKSSPLNSSTTGSDNCPAGFNYNPHLLRCFDINECEEQIDICNQESESCINEPGGYRCGPKLAETATRSTLDRNSCQTGYRMHPTYRSCIDINECTEGPDSPCDSNQQCVNTRGSYVCSCRTGFHLEAITKACVDINECQVNQHNCLNSQRCDNTIGSFQCIRFTSCGTGYTLNSQSGLCEDDDECALQIDDCHAHGPTWQCRNTAGSFRCEKKRCEPTFKLNNAGVCIGPDGRPHSDHVGTTISRPVSRGTTATTPSGTTTSLRATQSPTECPYGYRFDHGECTDINECETRNICRKNQRCVNTGGSFMCINLLNCKRGFEMNEEATSCIDIDECARNTHECSRGQNCVNQPGGYMCQCPPGHIFTPAKECVDVDECLKYAGQVCAANSDCENTIGSYLCNCKVGFKQAKDSKACEDLDECAESPGICQHSCVNVWGSYRCACRPGFTMNKDNRSCADIDECEMFRDRHICVGPCVNQPGSYTCRCPEGYNLGSDGRTCQDIDECQGGTACPSPNEICVNTRGSYRCSTISCPPNFIKDTEHKKSFKEQSTLCRRMCAPRDTVCSKNNTKTVSYQFISIPSMIALPNPLVLTRIQAVSTNKASLLKASFEILHGNEEAYFDFVSQNEMGDLRLARPVQGPKQFVLTIQMKISSPRRRTAAKHIAEISISVSEYHF